MTHGNTPCPICSGNKTIRLPVLRTFASIPDAEPLTKSIDGSTRTYPCPECKEVQDHSLHVAYAAGSAYSIDLERHHDAREVLQHATAHDLVGYMQRHGLVHFSEHSDPAGRFGMTEIVAKLAVVSPDRITSLEQRVKEATGPAIAAAADRAIRKINVWGSHYGRNTVTKEEATRFIREAVQESAE